MPARLSRNSKLSMGDDKNSLPCAIRADSRMLYLRCHRRCGLHECLRPVGHHAAREKLLALEGLEAGTILSLDGIARGHESSSGRLPGSGAHHPRPPKGVRMVTSLALGSSRRGVAVPRCAATNSV